jgi:hypothetical protein
MAKRGVQGSDKFCMAVGLPSTHIDGRILILFLSFLVDLNFRCFVVQYWYYNALLSRFMTCNHILNPAAGLKVKGIF